MSEEKNNNRKGFFRIQDEFSILIFEQLAEKLVKNGIQSEAAEHALEKLAAAKHV